MQFEQHQQQQMQENDPALMPPVPTDQDADKIREITPEIIAQILSEYPRIQSLDFSQNLLTNVTNLEACRHTLIALNLSQNLLDFPQQRADADGMVPLTCLGTLSSLVVLNLCQNQISSLSGSGIRNLAQLEELDLRLNNIAHLDDLLEELAHCKSLKVLNIQNNPIEKTVGLQSLHLILSKLLPQLQLIDGVQLFPRDLQTIDDGVMSSGRSDKGLGQQDPVMAANQGNI